MKAKLKWMIPSVIALLILTLGIVHFLSGRTKLNDTFVNGNTAGNLYNGGLFCEYDGVLYFANPNDNFCLYSMPAKGREVKKLSNDTVTFLNVDEHYIYYARNEKKESSDFSFLHWNNNSLCRIKKNGKDRVILDPDPSMYVSLLGNYLYYLHYDTKTATTMYRIKIDGSEKEMVEDQPYYTCSTDGKYLYYNGLEEDRNIYSLNTESGSSYALYKGDTWMPIVADNTAYYIDPQNNYCLSRVDLNTKETRQLTEERVDCFNIYGSIIYYARNEKPALCRMKIDGSDQEVIAEGIYTDINLTSEYAYFRLLNNPDEMYFTPLDGAPNVSRFSPSAAK